MLTPRWYQSQANAAVWEYLGSKSGNCVAVLPTGAGKSLLIALLIKQALEFGGRVVVLAHRKELLQQNADEIRGLIPGVDVGIYSAGLKKKEIHNAVVVAGIQSVYRKAEDLGRRHLILVDEAHLISDLEESMYGQFLAAMKANEGLRIVGLTATAFRTGTGPICGPERIFQRVVFEAKAAQLIAEGFLCPITNKVADAEVNTDKVSLRGGEFVESEMQAAFDVDEKVQAACEEILEKTRGRHSVLVFASGVHHAEQIAELLPGSAVVTGETLPIERAETLRRFVAGELRFLVNVDVLCLDEQTEILTRDGWTSIDQMTQSHLVASWDFDGSIKFAEPKLIVKRKRHCSERMVSLKTNGVDIRVTDNHRMVAWKGDEQSGRWTVKPASELVGKSVSLPAHGMAAPCAVQCEQLEVSEKTRLARIRTLSCVYRKKYGMGDSESKHAAAVGVDKRINLQFKNPVDLTLDECRFIGFWIGDGTKSCGRITVSQSLVYPLNIEWFDGVLDRAEIHYTKTTYKPASNSLNESIRWSFSKGTGGVGQFVLGGVNHLIPYLEKNGTDLFWGLNKQQFEAVLEGWWRADGLHHAKKQLNKIACVNRKLIDLMQAIATCRGIRTSVSVCSKPRLENHSQQYSFSWSDRLCISVYKNRFSYDESPSRDGERVWCVTSVTGNIVIRRNGKVSVVGNTTGFNAKCVDAIAILRATMSPGLFCQMVGRGLRLHPSKVNTLILDFGQNFKRFGPIDDESFGRSEGKGRAGVAAENGRGKKCPSCELDVSPSTIVCPECNFIFPRERELKHDTTADESSQLTGATPPEEWEVRDVVVRVHTKKDDSEAPQTVRVDYICTKNGIEGNLATITIPEWTCPGHQGFARSKFLAWWDARSLCDPPDNATDAVALINMGVCRRPVRITTKKDGRWHRITECFFESEKPTELAQQEETKVYSGIEDDLPF